MQDFEKVRNWVKKKSSSMSLKVRLLDETSIHSAESVNIPTEKTAKQIKDEWAELEMVLEMMDRMEKFDNQTAVQKKPKTPSLKTPTNEEEDWSKLESALEKMNNSYDDQTAVMSAKTLVMENQTDIEESIPKKNDINRSLTFRHFKNSLKSRKPKPNSPMVPVQVEVADSAKAWEDLEKTLDKFDSSKLNNQTAVMKKKLAVLSNPSSTSLNSFKRRSQISSIFSNESFDSSTPILQRHDGSMEVIDDRMVFVINASDSEVSLSDNDSSWD